MEKVLNSFNMVKKSLTKLYKRSPIKGVDIFIYVMLILMAFVFIYPFLYMFTTSIKSYSDIINSTIKWIPKNPTFKSYITAASVMHLDKTMVNSILVVVFATLGHLITCSFVAYGFARYNFFGKGLFFAIVILSIIVPTQVIILPLYITYTKVKLIGSILTLILPCFVGYGLKGGLFIFLYRQYFLGIPKALEEAATIDGCGPFKTFFRIALPSAGSTTIVCIVLSMVWHWNDFYEPSLYLKGGIDSMLVPQVIDQVKSLVEVLQNQFGDASDGAGAGIDSTMMHKGVTMAATAISLLPPMIGYLVLQRKFMEGIEHSGLTGM